MDIAEIQKRHSDQYYSAQSNEDLVMYRLIKRYLDTKKAGGEILDIGAGTGDMLDMLDSSLYQKAAIDISPVAVEIMKKKGVDACVSDVISQPLPYGDGSKDIVIATEILEHLSNPEYLLSEIFRILRPGGYLIASVPNIYQLATVFLYLLDIPPVNAARYGSIHFRDFTLRLYRQALREHGFQIKKIKGDIIFPFKGPFSRWLAGWWPRIAHRLLAFCVKPQEVAK